MSNVKLNDITCLEHDSEYEYYVTFRYKWWIVKQHVNIKRPMGDPWELINLWNDIHCKLPSRHTVKADSAEGTLICQRHLY